MVQEMFYWRRLVVDELHEPLRAAWTARFKCFFECVIVVTWRT